MARTASGSWRRDRGLAQRTHRTHNVDRRFAQPSARRPQTAGLSVIAGFVDDHSLDRGMRRCPGEDIPDRLRLTRLAMSEWKPAGGKYPMLLCWRNDTHPPVGSARVRVERFGAAPVGEEGEAKDIDWRRGSSRPCIESAVARIEG